MQTFLETFTTPGEVYAYCQQKKLKGKLRTCEECIVAVLLKAEYPERFENGEIVSVYPSRIKGTIFRRNSKWKMIEEVECPAVISRFAMNFDEGMYPDLIQA